LDIEYDSFIRTTDKEHEENVRNVFDQLKNNGKIYEGTYEGNYCSSCESYFTDSQAKENKCPDCGKEVYKLKQESYFLKVKEEYENIKKILNKKNFITPKTRVNELMSSFVDNDLKDLSVTRDNFK
jgi:methionyl-tRNA synthetase